MPPFERRVFDKREAIETASPGGNLDEDLGQQYAARRQTRQAAEAEQRLEAELAADAAVAPSTPADSVSGGPPPGNQAAAAPSSTPGRSALETTGAVVKDVVRGAAEAPRQAVGGVMDAGQEAVQMLDSFGDFLNENVADLTVEIPGLPEFLGNPLSVDLPTADPPKTNTGAAVRGIAQFLTGFLPAFKVAKAAGLTGLAAPAVAGAVTDFTVFDPQGPRLADLWKELKLPQNVLTDYLAADPGDAAIEGRFKNAVEGLGLGVVTDGLIQAARVIRAARRARGQSEPVKPTPLEELKAEFGEVTDRDFMILGDPNKPLFEVRAKEPGDGAAKLRAAEADVAGSEAPQLIEGAAETGPGATKNVFINFARIDAGDDIKGVIGQMAEAFSGSIDAARRGKVSFEATAELADDLGMSVPDLLSRRKGQPFNAEEALAARRLWSASAEKLLETARAASAPNAGEIDQFNFRRMMAVHYAIQAEVIGARTETARALNAWKIPAGGGVERAKAINDLVSAMGGPKASAEMARKLAILAASGAGPEATAQFVRRGFMATTADAIKEAWVNGLLSSPKTHVVNISSNLGVAVQQIYERGAAAGITRLRGRGAGVAPGEAAAMAYGMVESLKDAFKMGWIALRTGETGSALGKIDLPRDKAISARAFDLDEAGGLGRAVDYLGEAFRVPGRLLGAEDEFFKTIGYRMELHAQSLRQAVGEGLKGEDMFARQRELIANPPENIRIAAADAALYNTFTNRPGWFGDAVMRLRGADNPASPVILALPFVRTPVNIARYAFERTPFAPLVGQWRADIAAGGARRDIALARMATGTGIMLVAMDYADSGLVSGRGPSEAAERETLLRQGWQPYSIKVGDRWVSFNRADPFGMTMGFAADIAEGFKRGEIDADDVDEWQEIVALSIAAVAQVTVNKTYMQGFAEVVSLMTNPDRYTEGYVNDMVASFVPFTALSGAIESAGDPTLSETNNPGDAISARILGLSDRLPPRRDLWGEPVRLVSGLGKTYDFFAPWSSRAVKKSPIDAELQRLGASITRIKKKTSFDGINVNLSDWPEVYDAYTKAAGNGLKHPAWNLGARDFLDRVVTGKHEMAAIYGIGSDGKAGGKQAFIRNTITEYRQLAQRQILADPKFARFAEHIRAERARKDERALPVLAGRGARATNVGIVP